MAEENKTTTASAAVKKSPEDNFQGAKHSPAGAEKERYKGDVFAPGAELLGQIAKALDGGEVTPGVKTWLAEYNRINKPAGK